jgi:hypothetical protein
MARIYEIRELAGVISRIGDTTRRAHIAALIRTVQLGEKLAKINSRNVFKGTRIRPKTGNLMNSIFSGYVLNSSGDDIAEGVVGVRSKKGNAGTRPYGRIHEYGGPIVPRKAKNLWIPLLGPKTTGPGSPYRNMSPSDFVDAMKQRQANAAARFAIIPGRKGPVAIVSMRNRSKARKVKEKVIAMFALRQHVEMPERPYIRPAVREALKAHKGHAELELKRLDKDHT